MGRMLRLRHGEAFDVVAAPREHPGDPGKDAGLVVHGDGERMAGRGLGLGRGRVMRSGRMFHRAHFILSLSASAKSTAACAWTRAESIAGSAKSCCESSMPISVQPKITPSQSRGRTLAIMS